MILNENIISNAEQNLKSRNSLSTLNPFDETSSTLKLVSQENLTSNPFHEDSENDFIINNIVNLDLNDTNMIEFCSMANEISDQIGDSTNDNNNAEAQLGNDNKQLNVDHDKEYYLNNDESIEINSANQNSGEISPTTKSSSTCTTTTTTSQTYLI